jgi:hypothetical protein
MTRRGVEVVDETRFLLVVHDAATKITGLHEIDDARV